MNPAYNLMKSIPLVNLFKSSRFPKLTYVMYLLCILQIKTRVQAPFWLWPSTLEQRSPGMLFSSDMTMSQTESEAYLRTRLG